MRELPEGCSVVSVDEVDEADFSELFEASVGKQKPRAYFSFNRSSTPHGRPVRRVLVHGSRLIGSHTIRPLALSVDGRRARAGLTMDSFIHPEFRKQGMFTALVRETTREAQRQGMEAVFGFANANSIDIYTGPLGHSHLDIVNYIRIEGRQGGPGGEAEVFDHRLPDYADAVIGADQNRSLFPISVLKEPDYVEWRYLRSPEYRYTVLARPDSFVALLKEYEGEMQVVDFFYTKEDCLLNMLGAVCRCANSRGKVLSMWIAASHPLLRLIPDDQYSTLLPPQFFHILCLQGGPSDSILKAADWHCVMGDSDVF